MRKGEVQIKKPNTFSKETAGYVLIHQSNLDSCQLHCKLRT
jgi:hypothetical protein